MMAAGLTSHARTTGNETESPVKSRARYEPFDDAASQRVIATRGGRLPTWRSNICAPKLLARDGTKPTTGEIR